MTVINYHQSFAKLSSAIPQLFVFYTYLVSLIVCQKFGPLVPSHVSIYNETVSNEVEPTMFIAVLARNKAHTLPYFLDLIGRLDYPKDRISIWIKSDHNEDDTPAILRTWEREVGEWGNYHSVSVSIVDSPPYRQSDQEESQLDWTPQRFRHIIRLKEEAIKLARKVWADYIWFLDADVFIINNQTLRSLVQKKKPLVTPMLQSGSGSMYSNFWGGIENYYYVRTEEYKEIIEFKKQGCFEVPLISAAVLMDLRPRVLPSFERFKDDIPLDDMILFAANARRHNITMEVCNDMEYGYIVPPLENEANVELDFHQMINMRVEISSYWNPPLVSPPFLKKYLLDEIKPSNIGFDKVFMINLKRRPDRLEKMKNSMKILGIDYEYREAVDGTDLTQKDLDDLGIVQLPAYRDPYSGRTMKFGEIGCFLSHYNIWKDMVKQRINTALILEDDIHFEPYFVYQVQKLFEEAGNLFLDWDLMYLGRKRSYKANEPWVEGSKYIVHVDYSYWTLGYVLTFRGAKKLLEGRPLEKLVPVDEYLPIMFDRHNNATWMEAFPKRDLKAFSAEPLLLYPTHYTNEKGYISDTEKSDIILKEKMERLRKEEEEEQQRRQMQQEQSSENCTANNNICNNKPNKDDGYVKDEL